MHEIDSLIIREELDNRNNKVAVDFTREFHLNVFPPYKRFLCETYFGILIIILVYCVDIFDTRLINLLK